MTALLPCPFCGGPVALEEAHVQRSQQFGNRQFYGVVCRNTINLGGTCCMEQVPSARKHAAISRWNMRNGVAHVAQIFGPDGALWATAPDSTWFLRDTPWPDPGIVVEVCWSSRFKVPAKYNFDRLKLVKHEMIDGHDMSQWKNEFGSLIIFNPDFWRPIK